MPDGNTPPTVPPITMGGQGAPGGHFAIASLEELDGLIKKWTELHDEIRASQIAFDEARRALEKPAGDTASAAQVAATEASLNKAAKHNDAMAETARAYLDNMRAARKQYANTEAGNSSAITQSGA
ncbi:hypothetical protein ACOBQX_17180 [Actinokineospora sp. G85]|uniref:hypothetical protein n=1 Tax=Actinokineospora sp. G85 TaxID=3406626 RepID=UPI003C7195B6